MGAGEARAGEAGVREIGSKENREEIRAGGLVRKVSTSFTSARKLRTREATLTQTQEARVRKAGGEVVAARDLGTRETGTREHNRVI